MTAFSFDFIFNLFSQPSFKITTRQEYDMALYLIEKITLEMTKYNCMIASPEAVLAAGR